MHRKFYFIVLVGALVTLVPPGTIGDTANASVYLGNNFLVGNESNTLSDVSQANAKPTSLVKDDVVFGYQQLGQVVNTTNSSVNIPSGAAWVLFSFQVDSIFSNPSDGVTYVDFKPTPAGNALSLQTLVPTLFAQTGLPSSDPLVALEVNTVPDAVNKAALISANTTMLGAMASFNGGPFSTEFGFGLVAANDDFLTVFGSTAKILDGTILSFTEAGGASVLYNSDNIYQGFAQLANQNPGDGTAFDVTNQVAIAGTIFQKPGTGAAPPAQTGAKATDHATYSLEPVVPEPASIAVWSLLALIVGGTGMRYTR